MLVPLHVTPVLGVLGRSPQVWEPALPLRSRGPVQRDEQEKWL